MNRDDFESQLRKRRFRRMPGEWREEILRTAEAARLAEQRTSPWAWVWWRELFWPSPRAWAGLAVAWCVILLVNVPNSGSPGMATAAPPDRILNEETATFLREQRRMLAELIGAPQQPEASEPGTRTPAARDAGPRSQAPEDTRRA